MSRPTEVKTTYLNDYRPSSHLIKSVDLTIEITKDCTIVTNRMQVVLNELGDQSKDLQLDGDALSLLEVKVNGEKCTANATKEGLLLKNLPEQFELIVKNKCFPDKNTQLSGLYRSKEMLCTQCEPQGFRRITYYLDRPDILAIFKTTIIADAKAYPVLLSNGNLVEDEMLSDGRRKVCWEDPHPKPAYLFALVAGDLEAVNDKFTTSEGREVKIVFYVHEKDKHKCAHAIESLKQAMLWDEETFGLAYDLDNYFVVAVDDFNMGAMENKGLNIFNTKYVLADTKTATDKDFQLVQAVIGHEYFHNWTGNRVTCRDWFQLSLKEGLTVFREQLFAQDMGMSAVKRIEGIQMLKTRQFAEDAGPMAHPIRPDSYIEINNFYTLTIYEKGAEVIRMIHTILGDADFKKGLRLYFERHDGQAVTTNDFVDAMADASGVDFTQFKNWYTQAGTPVLTVSDTYDPESQTYQITFSQMTPDTPGQTDKKPVVIPINLSLLVNRVAFDLPASQKKFILSDSDQTIIIENCPAKPVPVVLEGFSAPVRLVSNIDQSQRLVLLASSSDAYIKWDASKQWMTKNILEGENADELNFSPYIKLFQDQSLDQALLSHLIQVPDISFIMEQITGPVQLDWIIKNRKRFGEAFAAALHTVCADQYRKLIDNQPYTKDDAAMTRRVLKNTCLGLWCQTVEPEAIKAALEQYKNADNMTDRMGALNALNNLEDDSRAELMSDFYETYKDTALIVNKWLALEATSVRPDVLKRIKALTLHDAFDMANPNKVYSLINAFAQQNLTMFHQANGEGYSFISDMILQLDKSNPQVAARVAGAFNQWKRLDNNRQALIRPMLEKLCKKVTSKDVYEITSKALNG